MPNDNESLRKMLESVCRTCNGKGKLIDYSEPSGRIVTCDRCGGTGRCEHKG